MKHTLKYFSFLDEFVNLAGWGLKRDTDGEYKPTQNLKIMSLQVNPKNLCEYIFSPEQLAINQGKEKLDILSKQRLTQKFKYGFSSGINCVGNDFVISQGNIRV